MPFSAPTITSSAQVRVYAVGDIHGHARQLRRMHEAISHDLNDNPPDGKVKIIHLGDYVDRGPDNAEVFDILIALKETGSGVEHIFLEGNHEHALIRFIEAENPHEIADWLKWGGIDTLASYGVYVNPFPLPSEIERAADLLRRNFPAHHRDFVKALALTHEEAGHFFVHAGVNPKKPFSDQKPRDLRGIREPFLSWDGPLEKRVVHGHTVFAEPQVHAHRIGIDTGLYAGGPLTCAVIEGESVRFLQVR